jgi:hypothetical protein
MAGYGPHRVPLDDALRRAFPRADALRRFVELRLELNFEDVDGSNLPTTRLNLIKWAEATGRERDLVAAAREAQPENRVLEAIAVNIFSYLDEVSPLPWYEPPHPVRTCFIGSEKAIVDRVSLREYVSELMAPDGPRALVVQGAPGSGKSYSLDFIRFIEDKSRDFSVANISLSSPDITPHQLLRSVAYAMGLAGKVENIPPEADQQEQATRWNDDLCAWLFAELRDSEKPWWLIIDGIDQVKLRPATYDLITKLMQGAETARPLRVVLLACSEPLPRVRVRVEEIGAITDEVLRTFFRDFLNHQQREATDDAVDQAIQEVHRIVAVERDDPLWLMKLSGAVALVAKTL